MADKAIKAPTNRDEEAALQRALYDYQITRLEAAMALLDSERLAAFLGELEALMADGLPLGSSAATNLGQVPGFFADVRAGIRSDITLRGGTLPDTGEGSGEPADQPPAVDPVPAT